jgi:hypothetical protein
MTGFGKLQTRGTSNLTIQTKYSDCNTLVLDFVGEKYSEPIRNKINFTILNLGAL